jgi:hypothetical protein
MHPAALSRFIFLTNSSRYMVIQIADDHAYGNCDLRISQFNSFLFILL